MNNKLATLKFSHFGGYPSACKAASPTQRFIALSDPESPNFFEAGRAIAYSSFKAFQNRILKNPLSHTASAVSYQGVDGTRFTMFLDTGDAPRINGSRPSYEPPLMFNSPFMKSAWGSGNATIKFGSQSASYDFCVPNAPKKVVQ